jgi:hypothetical protein
LQYILSLKYELELIGHPLRNTAYNTTKSYKDIPSTVRGSLSSVINKTLTENKKNILSGKVSIPSFTKDKMPVYFMSQSSKLHINENNYLFQITSDLTFKLQEFDIYSGTPKALFLTNQTLLDPVFDCLLTTKLMKLYTDFSLNLEHLLDSPFYSYPLLFTPSPMR